MNAIRLRELPAVGVALLLHAAFFGVARTLPQVNLLLERGSSEVAGLLWIDTDATEDDVAPKLPSESAVSTKTLVERDEARSPADPKLGAATRSELGTSSTHSPAQEGAEASAANEALEPPVGGGASQATQEAAAAGPPSDGFSPLDAASGGPVGAITGLFAPSSGLGLAGQIALDGADGQAAPTRAPSAKLADGTTVNKLLGSTLLGQTREKGIDLPATQVVAGAVGSATRALPVPHNTRASFSVRLGPGGNVLGVKVASSSAGDASAWEGAAKAVAAQLSGQSLGLGDAASTGATVIVSVQVRHVFPTGTAKGADVKPVCANQLINDLVDGMDKKPSAAVEGVVPLFQDENGRPCIPVGMAGVADAANIGATKQIQVTTSTRVLIDGKEALPLDIKPVNKDPIWVDTGKGGPRPNMPQKMRKYKRDREKKK